MIIHRPTSSEIDVCAYLVHRVDGVSHGPVDVGPLVRVHAAGGVVLDARHKARPGLRKQSAETAERCDFPHGFSVACPLSWNYIRTKDGERAGLIKYGSYMKIALPAMPTLLLWHHIGQSDARTRTSSRNRAIESDFYGAATES